MDGQLTVPAATEPIPDEEASVLQLMEPVTASEGLVRVGTLAKSIAAGKYPPCLLIWRAHPALVATGSEARLAGFDRASAMLLASGWPVVTRKSGGGLFPVTPDTLQMAVLRRHEQGLSFDNVYDHLARTIIGALASMGLEGEVGEVPTGFCPGRYDIAIGGRKLAGLSQHWPADGSIIAEASVLMGGDPHELAAAVNCFHVETGSGRCCDPAAITSVAGELDPFHPSPVAIVEMLSDAICAVFRSESRPRMPNTMPPPRIVA